jgi:cytosine/adenosine deaminase-related metal-dependent hydrolase
MILRNLRTIEDSRIDIFFAEMEGKNVELIFEDAMVFPGLINSHDHLDFNLYRQLGERTYANYTEWGNAIHSQYKNEIEKVLRVPLALRAQWGVYKNLLCGVTTVVNHGDRLDIEEPLITILQEEQSLHSVAFEKQWKLKLNNPIRKDDRCIIHTGEGIDAAATKEIDQLVKWNLFGRGLIGVHGIAMNPEQSSNFQALVWCPVSNYFLFNKTAAIDDLETKILFGTDSTLTGHWNIWEHLRFARTKTSVSSKALFDMITKTPAEVWEISGYSNAAELPSDIVIAKARPDKKAMELFFELNPEDILLVVHRGKIRLFDESLHSEIAKTGFDLKQFSCCSVHGVNKFVQGDIIKLTQQIRNYYPDIVLPIAEEKLPA